MKPLVKRHFWNGFIQEKIESVQQKISLATKDFEQLGRNLAQLHAMQPAVSKQFEACNSNTIKLADHLLMSTISWLEWSPPNISECRWGKSEAWSSLQQIKYGS